MTNRMKTQMKRGFGWNGVKRWAAAGLAGLAGVVLGDRTQLDPTKTQFALPLEVAPTIDGVIEAGEWARAAGGSGEWRVFNRTDADGNPVIRGGAIGDAGTPPVDDADLSFNIYAGYDANYLYVAVHVTDDVISVDSAEENSANGTTWMDDSVEVFVDGDNSNLETRDTSGSNPAVVGTGGQYVITANNAYRDAEAGSPGYGEAKPWFAKTALRADGKGYDAEFRISLKLLGDPKPGDIVGFTVGVNDDDDGSGGERQVIWVGKPHTEAGYGNLILGRRDYAAPKVSGAPVVDGVIKAEEYAGATEIRVDGTSGNYELDGLADGFPATDHRFRAWVVHTADSVHVAVEVTDDVVATDSAEALSEDKSTWEDDSIEIFFDADHSLDLGRGGLNFEGQYVVTANGAWRDNEANNPTFGATADWNAVAVRTAAGYAAEFRVRKSALVNPADGAVLGFNVAVNDDDGANRKSQLNWCGRPHHEFTYGTLKLAGAVVVGGTVTITGIREDGNNLRIDFTSSNPAGRFKVVSRTAVAQGAWTEVAGVTVSPGAGEVRSASFTKPQDATRYYRLILE